MKQYPKKLSQKHLKVVDKVSGYDKQFLLKKFRLSNGLVEQFFVDVGRDSVQVVAQTEDGKFLLVQQWRAGNEQMNFEFPGGGLDSETEKIEEAAIRELLEETGYKGEKLELLVSIPYSPYSTGIRHTFLATNCKKIKEKSLDPNEFLEVFLVTKEELMKMLLTGSVRGVDAGMLAFYKLGLFEFTSSNIIFF